MWFSIRSYRVGSVGAESGLPDVSALDSPESLVVVVVVVAMNIAPVCRVTL